MRTSLICLSKTQQTLSAPGLNTSSRKVELVARAFPAIEIKMNKISSSASSNNLKLVSAIFHYF